MKVLFLLMKDIVYVYKTSIKKGLGDQNKLYNSHFSGDSKYMSHEIVDVWNQNFYRSQQAPC